MCDTILLQKGTSILYIIYLIVIVKTITIISKV